MRLWVPMQAQPGNYLVGGGGTGQMQFSCYHNSHNVHSAQQTRLEKSVHFGSNHPVAIAITQLTLTWYLTQYDSKMYTNTD